MSNVVILWSCLLLVTAGCTETPAPSSAKTDPCPAPTSGCMNEENHAECKRVAATCSGEVLQLESCPLQFSCSE